MAKRYKNDDEATPLTFACPNCGEDVEVGSRGCPRCSNSDPQSWEQDEYLDGTDIPTAENFDYDEFIARELQHSRPRRVPFFTRDRILALIALALLLAMLAIAVPLPHIFQLQAGF